MRHLPATPRPRHQGVQQAQRPLDPRVHRGAQALPQAVRSQRDDQTEDACRPEEVVVAQQRRDRGAGQRLHVHELVLRPCCRNRHRK
jgi:hypothetical protein